MRFFIALEIPEESRQDIENIQRQIQKIIPHLKLTGSHKFHLTIAFIGDQDEECKDALINLIKESTANIPPFEVSPAYLDGFPSLHSAKVFWLGVKGDIDKLMILRERIKDGLKRLHLEIDERRYIPHIAIAKAADFQMTDSEEASLQELMLKPLQPFTIDSIKLFESIPQEGFHDHNTLAEIKLR
ncbi:MAG: RNA 2',3'-cyclic phosphodiesterase [Candidatus Daviesbacteria bacterium]|nr:RNA 2',3'-cyclic phosphodiesterase [Candidatus Daviesbacteria bacterium]